MVLALDYAELTGPRQILGIEAGRDFETFPVTPGRPGTPEQLDSGRFYRVRFKVPAQLLGGGLTFDHTYEVQVVLFDDGLLERDGAARELGYRCISLFGGFFFSLANADAQTFSPTTDDEASILACTEGGHVCPPALQFLRILPFTEEVVAIEAGPQLGIEAFGPPDPRDVLTEEALAEGRWYRVSRTALAVPLNFEEPVATPSVPVERTWDTQFVFYDDQAPLGGGVLCGNA